MSDQATARFSLSRHQRFRVEPAFQQFQLFHLHGIRLLLQTHLTFPQQCFLMGGVEDDHQFKHTTPLAYFSPMRPLHFAEFIRFGGHHCFGTAIAPFDYESYTLQLAKEIFHGYSST